MLLKKEYLERFFEIIESRGGRIDKDAMSATIPTDDATWMHVAIRDDLEGSPCYSVSLDGGPGGWGDSANINVNEIQNKCRKILEGIINELEEEGC